MVYIQWCAMQWSPPPAPRNLLRHLLRRGQLRERREELRVAPQHLRGGRLAGAVPRLHRARLAEDLRARRLLRTTRLQYLNYIMVNHLMVRYI